MSKIGFKVSLFSEEDLDKLFKFALSIIRFSSNSISDSPSSISKLYNGFKKPYGRIFSSLLEFISRITCLCFLIIL